MIMQTFRRWLNKLFGWWPWKNSTTIDQVQPASSAGWSTFPETTWRSSINKTESATPQTGNTSIAIEQGTDNTHPDVQSIRHDLPADTSIQAPSPTTNNSDFLAPLPILSNKKPDDTTKLPTRDSTDTESHLLFLRYLVQNGIVNEGFKEGQIPKQYRTE
ncbi:hypothetical protein [Dictyobacter formicarum]|uniref:hypothetical protein n=1 Tax=Dictyobacter formicarum TaxID=2778368 RepID=UPI001916409E|nr:hypothetical protein [Dictyobacter formicarum]